MPNVSEKAVGSGVGAPKVATCRDCGAEVLWARRIKKDGTVGNLPFDPVHSPEGTHQLRRTKDGEIWADWISPKQRHLSQTLRTVHLDTCPMRPPRNG